jgi:hypothetical protein
MSPVWAVVLVLVAFAVVLRLKNRRKNRPAVAVYARRIEGFQVVAQLEPNMPGGCLFDHGIQYGKGFRRKEGPALPHAGNCRCATMPFSFTSNEVFNGALRNFAEVRTDIPDLPVKPASRLADQMKRVESSPLSPTLEGYIAAVDMGKQPDKTSQAVRDFLTARYEHLNGEGKATALPRPSDAEVAADNQE